VTEHGEWKLVECPVQPEDVTYYEYRGQLIHPPLLVPAGGTMWRQDDRLAAAAHSVDADGTVGPLYLIVDHVSTLIG
jgi:hypothetical protein